MAKVLFVVSATLSGEVGRTESTAGPPGPRKDYQLLAERLLADGGDVLDRSAVNRSRLGRVLARTLGVPVAQAWLAFERRRRYDAILTDGEHVGIPLALLLQLVRSGIAHVTIGHRLSAPQKRPFFRWLKAHHQLHRIALHATRQYTLALTTLSIPTQRLALVPYQADTEFWMPQEVPEERMICSAGREFRDYPTLFRAVDGLGVRVVIGAASHWSKRRNTALAGDPPANVEIGSFDYLALRDLYARAAVVVVPVEEIDFQAGVTTLLEAMAMGKPVIVTRTSGQTDVVEGPLVTANGVGGLLPAHLLRQVATEAGIALEPTGLYVPPADPVALRRAICYLLDHEDERRRMGAAARRTVQALMRVDQFAERLHALVLAAVDEQQKRRSTASAESLPAAVRLEPELSASASAAAPAAVLGR